ncbi:hypothetical protein LXL04_019469 [Taraxacum kok-saghyz]
MVSLFHYWYIPFVKLDIKSTYQRVDPEYISSVTSLCLSGSFENSYIPENLRTLKPLTFSKNRLRGAKHMNKSRDEQEYRRNRRNRHRHWHRNRHREEGFGPVPDRNRSEPAPAQKWPKAHPGTGTGTGTGTGLVPTVRLATNLLFLNHLRDSNRLTTVFRRKSVVTSKMFSDRTNKKLGSFENSYIPENPRTPKPLTFSKNRLWGAKKRSKTSSVAKFFFRINKFFFFFAYVQLYFLFFAYAIFFLLFEKKYSFFRKFVFATGLVFERFLAPEVVLGSFENSYIPENPRTPPISYISQTVIPFKKPTSGPSKTFKMITIR